MPVFIYDSCCCADAVKISLHLSLISTIATIRIGSGEQKYQFLNPFPLHNGNEREENEVPCQKESSNCTMKRSTLTPHSSDDDRHCQITRALSSGFAPRAPETSDNLRRQLLFIYCRQRKYNESCIPTTEAGHILFRMFVFFFSPFELMDACTRLFFVVVRVLLCNVWVWSVFCVLCSAECK